VAALSLSRSVTVLGSTGSIGVSTLDLLGHARDGGSDIEVVALTAGRNVARLAEQALQWRPKMAVIEDETLLPELRDRLGGSGIETSAGGVAVAEAADMDASWVMSSIVGAAGLPPTLAAARRGALVALANKESIVCAGPILLETARKAGGVVVPVDSEHSAIFQSLQENWKISVARLILTASGGPFRTWDRQSMSAASPEQAVAHPNWSMGAKISIDSATMMNKALEMIEASYLFSMPPEQIDVLVHPQSIIHSMVEYADGSTLAQLGLPDMRAPIAFALAWPDRISWPAPKLDLAAIGSLTFEQPDLARFPAIALARTALSIGGGAPAAMNAANEVAVAAFLARRIGFLDIASTVERVVERLDGAGELKPASGDIIESAMAIDALARRTATDMLTRAHSLN
jgi:1-deoxy-D-xylulose-5-phosphate reductoisomerase